MILEGAWSPLVLGLMAIGGFVLAGWWPRTGLFALVALSPAQFVFFPVGSVFVSPADVLVVSGLAGLGVRIGLGDPAAWRAVWLHRWLFVMILGYLAGSLALGAGSRTLVRVPLAVAPSLLVCAYLTTERSLRTALACVVVAGAADAAYGVAQSFFGVPVLEGRFGAVAGVNFDAMVILAGAAVAWALWTQFHGLIWASILTVLGVATLSRGGLLAFALAFGVAIIPVLRWRARWLVFGSILVIVASATGIGVVQQVIRNRMEERTENWSGSRTSTEIRLFVLRVAWRAVVTEPFTGIGFGGFVAYSAEDPDIAEVTNGEGFATHNTPLEILAEGGLLAFVPFSLYCLSMVGVGRRLLGRAWRARDRVAAASAAALIVVVVSGIFANVLLHYCVWVSFGLALQCDAVQKQSRRHAGSESNLWLPRRAVPAGPETTAAVPA